MDTTSTHLAFSSWLTSLAASLARWGSLVIAALGNCLKNNFGINLLANLHHSLGKSPTVQVSLAQLSSAQLR